jgi:hypothetical protein
MLWRSLHESHDIDTPSRVLLEVALRASDRAAQARELIARDGLIVAAGRDGKSSRAHPALGALKEAEMVLLRAWRQLGFDQAPPGHVGHPAGQGPV